MIAERPTGHGCFGYAVSWAHGKFLPGTLAPESSNTISIESLVATHYGFVWRVLRGLAFSRADADDAAQQVFMIAAHKLENVAPDRARSFIYGVTLRVANNARRRIRRRREVPVDESDADRVDPESPEHATELVRARALVSELLAQLPDKLRRAMILAEIEQLEVLEIAKLERIPVGTAASRLRLARKQFRELLAAAHDRNPFGQEE